MWPTLPKAVIRPKRIAKTTVYHFCNLNASPFHQMVLIDCNTEEILYTLFKRMQAVYTVQEQLKLIIAYLHKT